jgi:hypothetical protein
MNIRSNERMSDVYHRAPTESGSDGVSFEQVFGMIVDPGYGRRATVVMGGPGTSADPP